MKKFSKKCGICTLPVSTSLYWMVLVVHRLSTLLRQLGSCSEVKALKLAGEEKRENPKH